MDTYEKVKASFGPSARNYATSPSHSNADNLAALCDLVHAGPEDVALDVATGAGNLALALAPRVKRVVASDLTPEMVSESARRASEQGLTNFEAVLAAAEDLPFGDSEFTLATCRVGAHHFADVHKAMAEMARVLKPGGRLCIVDTTAPEDDALDREVNAIELLRDPSHVRNYRASEWVSMTRAAGLQVIEAIEGSYDNGRPMPFEPWLKRIGTSEESSARLRTWFREASPALKQALQIRLEPEISFVLPQVILLAVKC